MDDADFSELTTRELDGEPLPLPVRSTRYVVGGILVLVIVTVVLTTYWRIEQQLQATLEARLVAVLKEHVETAKHWINDTQTRTRQAASLSPLRNYRRGLDEEKFVLALYSIRQLGDAEELYVLDFSTGEVIQKVPETAVLPKISPKAFATMLSKEGGVDFSALAESGRIFSSSVPGKKPSCSPIATTGRETVRPV